MKALDQIKEGYALSRKFKSWDNFCFVANDSMFVKAIDEIAMLYAEYKMQLVLEARRIPDVASRQPALAAAQLLEECG